MKMPIMTDEPLFCGGGEVLKARQAAWRRRMIVRWLAVALAVLAITALILKGGTL